MFIATINQEAAKPGQRPQVDIPRKTYKINKTITEHIPAPFHPENGKTKQPLSKSKHPPKMRFLGMGVAVAFWRALNKDAK